MRDKWLPRHRKSQINATKNLFFSPIASSSSRNDFILHRNYTPCSFFRTGAKNANPLLHPLPHPILHPILPTSPSPPPGEINQSINLAQNHDQQRCTCTCTCTCTYECQTHAPTLTCNVWKSGSGVISKEKVLHGRYRRAVFDHIWAGRVGCRPGNETILTPTRYKVPSTGGCFIYTVYTVGTTPVPRYL